MSHYKYKTGEIILEAAALTSGVVVGLTLYTFWAVKRGHDFNFLGPFLFASLLVLFMFSLIQVKLTYWTALSQHKAHLPYWACPNLLSLSL